MKSINTKTGANSHGDVTTGDAIGDRVDPDRLIADMVARAAAWEQADDGRAVFLDCYARMTDAVVTAVADGRFVDGPWVLLLLDRFAGYYTASIDGGPAGSPIPEPWVLAHAAAVGDDAHPMQLLLAGVNAHINYDLVMTLVDLLEPEWQMHDASLIERRKLDYDEINQVIAETADLVQDRVIERRAGWMDVLDRGLGRWDERMAVRLLGGWRNRVWRQSIAMLELNDPDERQAQARTIEVQCVRRARILLI